MNYTSHYFSCIHLRSYVCSIIITVDFFFPNKEVMIWLSDLTKLAEEISRKLNR